MLVQCCYRSKSSREWIIKNNRQAQDEQKHAVVLLGVTAVLLIQVAVLGVVCKVNQGRLLWVD